MRFKKGEFLHSMKLGSENRALVFTQHHYSQLNARNKRSIISTKSAFSWFVLSHNPNPSKGFSYV